MRIALGADHAGVDLKNHIRSWLEARGIACADFGTETTSAVDYPDYASRVGSAVASGAFDIGLLFCGSGVGMAIAANKVPGIRAVAAVDKEMARLSRAHNDANVLGLGARLTTPANAVDLVHAFLETAFEGGRHQQRLEKIAAMDQVYR